MYEKLKIQINEHSKKNVWILEKKNCWKCRKNELCK